MSIESIAPNGGQTQIKTTNRNEFNLTPQQQKAIAALGPNPNIFDVLKAAGINVNDAKADGLSGFYGLQSVLSDSNDANVLLDKYGLSRYRQTAHSKMQMDWIDNAKYYYGTEYWPQYLAMAPSVFQNAANDDPDFGTNRDQSTGQEIAELGSIKREESHNSYAGQVAQMQQAGLNPDLSGAPSGSGQATEQTEREIQQSEMFNKRVNFMSQIPLQFLSSILGLGETFQGFQSKGIDNALKGLQLQNGADSYIYNLLANTSPVWLKDENGNDTDKFDVDATTSQIAAALARADVSNIGHPRLRRALAKAKENYGYSSDGNFKPTLKVQQLISDMQNGVAQNRFAVGQIFGDPRYSDDMKKMIQKCSDYFKTYQQDIWDIQKRYNDAMAMTAEDNAIYNNEQIRHLMEQGVPKEEALRQVKSSQAEQAMKDYEKKQNDMWDNLLGLVDGNHWYNIIGMVLIGWLRSQAQQTVPYNMFAPRQSPQVTAPVHVSPVINNPAGASNSYTGGIDYMD